MSVQRKQYTEEFKSSVALDSVKDEKSLQKLASQYGTPPVQPTGMYVRRLMQDLNLPSNIMEFLDCYTKRSMIKIRHGAD